MRIVSRRLATEEDERRRQLREGRNRQIIQSDKQEIPRSDLEFGRHWIEDTRTGEFFRVYPNGDPTFSTHCPAYYVDARGDAVLLERAEPASRAELAERLAKRDARRAARDAEAKARRAARIRAGTP